MTTHQNLSFTLTAFALALGFSTGPAQADVVRLRTGGELRGQIVGENRSDLTTTIVTLSGSRISVEQDEIDEVERRSPLQEEYVTRFRQTPQTVEGKWELAEWCRQQGLKAEREEQLEEILDLDPDHPDARRILGYVNHLGRWLTREDEMAERGYFRYNGKWVTRQELELKEVNAAQQKAELAWIPKVRLWGTWLMGTDPQRSTNGLTELRKINDPDAIFALTKFLSQHSQEDVRLLYVEILGQISGPRSVPPLIDRILMDHSHFVRGAALRAISPERYSLAVPGLILALRHKSNPVINRAAEALGEIGDERAIPHLIDALVTRHVMQIQVPVAGGVTFTNGAGAGPFSGDLPPSVEIAARTGQLPYGAKIVRDPIPQQMRKVNVTQDLKNLPVLSALEKMTGQSLGFNERDWHVWWSIQKG